MLVGIASVIGIDVGERIAAIARDLGQAGDDVLDLLGIEPLTGLDGNQCLDLFFAEVAKRAFGVDGAELVARPFLDNVGDDEVLAVGSQLGERGHDAEIGIALRQVESAQLLLVGGEAIGVIAVVGLEETEQPARLLGVHFLLQAIVGKSVVADHVDGTDLRLVAFVDFEHQVDAVLVELDNLGIDGRGEAALALVQFDDPLDVGTDLRTGKDLARREPDFGGDLVRLDALVALEHDAVDDRVFLDRDHQIATVGARDDDVGEQLGRIEVFQRGIELLGGIDLPRDEVRISAHGLGLEALGALDLNRADCPRRRPRGGKRRSHDGRCGGKRRSRGGRCGDVLSVERGRNATEHGADQESAPDPVRKIAVAGNHASRPNIFGMAQKSAIRLIRPALPQPS